jgi:enoyl-CoA hydratase
MAETEDLILLDKIGAVAVVTMNRPHALNALSRALRRELARVIRALDEDATVRAIVLTGAGDRAFSAGLDLKELGVDPEALGSVGEKRAEDDPLQAIENCRHPVIAAINGVAVTGGFELALGCDVLLASPKARFADTHVRVGVMPGWGLSQKLARIIGPSRAKEMSFSGRFIDAQQASEWGLVSRVVAPDVLLDDAIALATEMAEADPAFLQNLKWLIDDGLAGTLGEGRAEETTRSADWNAKQTPQALEARLDGVFARGRGNTRKGAT